MPKSSDQGKGTSTQRLRARRRYRLFLWTAVLGMCFYASSLFAHHLVVSGPASLIMRHGIVSGSLYIHSTLPLRGYTGFACNWHLPHGRKDDWLPGLELVQQGTASEAIVVWLPLYIPLVVVLAGTFWLRYQLVRASALFCSRCDYDLRGNESGICPECGASVLPSKVGKKSG